MTPRPGRQRRSLASVSETATKGFGSKLRSQPLGDRLVRRNPFFFPRAVRLFDHLEAASFDERVQWTEERLKVVLRAAVSTSRYGRSVGSHRLADWPLLEKEAVRDDPDAFVGRGGRFAARASTSGTTGTPLKIVRSPRSLAIEQAAIDRLAFLKNVDLATAKVAVLRGDDVAATGAADRAWKDEIGGRRRAFASNRLTAATFDSFVDALASFEPDCLLAYPTVLESLSRLLEQRHRKLTIPLTLTSSEALSATARRLAENAVNTQVVDYYGQAERVCFAYSITAEKYTFLPGYGVVELIPVARSGVEPDGATLFEIVGTSLWNLAMPLIRYRTGDFVALPDAPSSSELQEIRYGLRTIPGVVGRTGDFLVSPAGAHLVGIDHIPRDVRNVLRLQFIQEARDAVRVLVLPKSGFGDEDRRQIEANIARKLPPTIRSSIEVVDSLERSSNGKTPLVIRRNDAAGPVEA